MKHELKLKDGKTVNLDTSVTLLDLQKFEKEGLVTKAMFASVLQLEQKPAEMGRVILDDAPLVLYASYLNAQNEGKTLDKEEFLEQVPYDFQFLSQIYLEFLGGGETGNTFAESFEEATDTKN